MSDNTSTSITCLERDVDRILATLRTESRPDDREIVEPGIVKLYFEELNYGGYCEMEEMHKAGLVFYGAHDSGSCYTAGVFCCDGKTLVQCNSDSDRDGPVATVRQDGTISKADARVAKRYWRVLKRAKEKLKAMAAEDTKARSP